MKKLNTAIKSAFGILSEGWKNAYILWNSEEKNYFVTFLNPEVWLNKNTKFTLIQKF